MIDARVPVILGLPAHAAAGDVVLAEAGAAAAAAGAVFRPAALVPAASLAMAGHSPGCPCCTPRLAAGRALAGLLQDRARGRIAFFTRVVVATCSQAGRAEVEAALATDPVASACFRLTR